MGLYSRFESLLDQDDTLQQLESEIWDSLQTATQNSRHAWNHGYFSTASVEGSNIDRLNSRTVILRSVCKSQRTIDCHTDVRSLKVADIAASDESSWLFYDSKSKIQLRANGTSRLLDDSETDEAWERTSLRSRAAYLSVDRPGSKSAGSSPPSTSDRHVTQEQSERGRQNFRIVRFDVRGFDWLYLRRSGHLRASVQYPNCGSPIIHWLVP
ncbi:MAG: hypothetical protein AAF939_16660 [Planctomycetota bacterium]